MCVKIKKLNLCSMLQNEFSMCTSENTHCNSKKHAYPITCQTSYVHKTFFKLYSNRSRQNGTPQCIASI